jgi:hypothetical protein
MSPDYVFIFIFTIARFTLLILQNFVAPPVYNNLGILYNWTDWGERQDMLPDLIA